MANADVLLLDDELVDEGCPLSADLELGDLTRLNVYERNWIENIACPEIHAFYAAARRAQVALQDETEIHRRAYLGQQMTSALKACDRTRARMRRLIAGEPEPGPTSDPSLPDLWAR